MGDINKLIRSIADKYVFDEASYPELVGKNEREKLIFAIKHSTFHFSKTAGKIAAICEDIDHGAEAAIDMFKKENVKMLINTLRMAEILEMEETQLISEVEKILKSE